MLDSRTHASKVACGWLIAILPLAGCSGTPRLPDDETREINAILDQVSSRYAEEGARRCISTASYRSVEIVDKNRLIFRGSGGKAWLNDLRHSCNGLRRNDRLVFELRDNRVCAMDRVRAVEAGAPISGAGPTCALGDFKPIPPGHAEHIYELLRQR